MVIQIVTGNLFEINNTDKVCIVIHQVNCKGIMGAGLAKEVRSLYPMAYDYYMHKCNNDGYGERSLGSAQFVLVADTERNIRYIVNLFGQNEYGRDKRYTSYDAIASGLQEVKDFIRSHVLAKGYGVVVRIPYRMGCGLGGGEWDIVYSIIKSAFDNEPYDVDIIYKDNS